jgi:predicted enzyme related to lactoylglutathione lyase
MTHPVVHWEIGGHDMSALREFYAKAFGWTIDDAGPRYALVQAVEGGLGGGLMQTREDIPPYVTVYVQVDDLDEALDQVVNLGGSRLVSPTAINDAASFAMFRDPEGNVVGLLQATGPVAG